MVTVCWAAKGGSGTTVVAATLALRSGPPSLLVDLDGELPSALGIPQPERPGIADWLASDAPPDQITDLFVELGPSTHLLPCRLGRVDSTAIGVDDGRLCDALDWMRHWERDADGQVVIDAGTAEPVDALADRADRSLLVTRACYLAVLRAAACEHRPTGVVVVREPGRSLGPHDIGSAIGAPVVAEVDWDPDVARAVDAGLLLGRFPRGIDRALRRAAA